jgi:hypothetical protein
MTQYNYSNSRIPEPITPAKISWVVHPHKYYEVTALLDSGAQVTCISRALARKLKFEHNRFGSLTGTTGTRKQRIYYLNIIFENKTYINRPVYEYKTDEHLLIGLDILNDFHLCLDGPNKITSFP